MGCSRGVPGLFRGVPGVFRGCSGGVPGCSGGVPGCSGGVPGCSGVFRVCSGFYRHPGKTENLSWTQKPQTHFVIETFQLITLAVCCGYVSNLICRRTINIREIILGVHGLMAFTVTLEATVLKVIRIFSFQPVDNDNPVILNIIVTLITCKSIFLVNFNKQKLNNPKTREKLTDKYSYLPSFALHVQSSLPYCADSNLIF